MYQIPDGLYYRVFGYNKKNLIFGTSTEAVLRFKLHLFVLKLELIFNFGINTVKKYIYFPHTNIVPNIDAFKFKFDFGVGTHICRNDTITYVNILYLYK